MSGVNPNSHEISGTGDKDLDRARLGALVATVNAKGVPASVTVRSNLVVSDRYDFSTSCSWKGGNASVELQFAPGGSIDYNRNWRPNSDSGAGTIVPGSVLRQGDGSIPGIDGANVGDYVHIWSDDVIPGILGHAGNIPSPLEVHQIVDIAPDGSLWFGGYIQDNHSINVKYRLVPKEHSTSGICFRDLVFARDSTLHVSNDPATWSQANIIMMNNVNNVVFEDVLVGPGGPRAVTFGNAYNVRLSNFSREGAETKHWDCYQVVACNVNGLVWGDSFLNDVRHIFTTSAGMSAAGRRYGTPHNILVHDHVVRATGQKNEVGTVVAGVILYDTHAEGRGIIFRDIKADMTGEEGNRFGNSRSRETVFDNIQVTAGNNGGFTNQPSGVFLSGDGCRVTGCSFDNLVWGVLSKNHGSFKSADDILVSRNTFKRMRGPIVDLTGGGNNLHISHNEAIDSGSAGHLIEIEGGAGHRVTHNGLSANNNDNRVSVFSKTVKPSALVVLGNVVDGYGAGDAGFGNGETGKSLQTAYGTRNITD